VPASPLSSGSVVLAEVVRSGFVEGRHRGSLVVVDPRGDVVFAAGDVTAPVFPRSATKPLQAAAMVELGYPGRDELLAIAAASHSGEPFHLTAVHRILAGAGRDESALRTPADWPLGLEAGRDVLRHGGSPASIYMNCSGKHAAMIATCVMQGWDLQDYRHPEHPLQQHLTSTIARLAGEPVGALGVDGCGAPVAALSLMGLARSFGRCVRAEPGEPERLVADAMRAFPEYVAGTGRDVTDLMSGVAGLLAKDGAEGVYAAALPDGHAFALKVDDGAERPRPLVAAAVLRWLGVQAAVLDRYDELELLGGGVPVGAVRVPASLLG
jgi:L-asparaginase II